jgi:non-homologous end joining protein Ku
VQEEAQVINLMEALRQSVAQAQQETGAAEAEAPPKKMAPSVKPAAKRKKKMA